MFFVWEFSIDKKQFIFSKKPIKFTPYRSVRRVLYLCTWGYIPGRTESLRHRRQVYRAMSMNYLLMISLITYTTNEHQRL